MYVYIQELDTVDHETWGEPGWGIISQDESTLELKNRKVATFDLGYIRYISFYLISYSTITYLNILRIV